MRVGVDKANGEIVVFNQTSEGIFHDLSDDELLNAARNPEAVNWVESALYTCRVPTIYFEESR